MGNSAQVLRRNPRHAKPSTQHLISIGQILDGGDGQQWEPPPRQPTAGGGGGGEGLEDGRGACVGGWWWEAGDRLPLPVPLPTDCIPAFEEV